LWVTVEGVGDNRGGGSLITFALENAPKRGEGQNLGGDLFGGEKRDSGKEANGQPLVGGRKGTRMLEIQKEPSTKHLEGTILEGGGWGQIELRTTSQVLNADKVSTRKLRNNESKKSVRMAL